MANEIYRSRIINAINYAVAEARNAVLANHPGLIGRIRELVATNLLTPLLPAGFTIGTGKILDTQGAQSGETDLIIYNKAVLPPVLYSERDGTFPVESCYYAIEVKSQLTAAAVRDAIEKGRAILNLNWTGKQKTDYPNRAPVVLVLFAFGSDLAETSSEIERYTQYDPTWDRDPVLKALCVVGRGYWYHKQSDNGWVGVSANHDHDEVIDLVSGIVNTLIKSPPGQRAALLGHYLSIERPATFTKRRDA